MIYLLCLSSVVFCPLLGCDSGNNEAVKLDSPEGIDWEAIENQGAEMNESQSKGE
ncbi:hypothetical protein U8335_26305 [Roseiconus lacunae]|nr:hypothetical protein U8335_26305 [Stieleria sp. HD01]